MSKVENNKYSSPYLYFWIGDSNAIDAFCEKLKEESDVINHAEITENWIRNRLENDDVFFNDAVEAVSEDLNYILRCIHENESMLPEEEWEEEYGEWLHIQTIKQVADEYYGREELISLIPEWYNWVYETLDDECP